MIDVLTSRNLSSDIGWFEFTSQSAISSLASAKRLLALPAKIDSTGNFS